MEPPNHVHAIWDCDYIPQKVLSEIWELITGDSFIVDIRKVDKRKVVKRKVDKQRWRKAVNYLAKYITKISKGGSCVDMSGVHVVNSWGDGGYYKKMQMVCKNCGCGLMALWYDGSVDDKGNDPVDFVISNKGPPLKYLQRLSFIFG